MQTPVGKPSRSIPDSIEEHHQDLVLTRQIRPADSLRPTDNRCGLRIPCRTVGTNNAACGSRYCPIAIVGSAAMAAGVLEIVAKAHRQHADTRFIK